MERAVWPLPDFPARMQLMHLGGQVQVREALCGAPLHLTWWSRAR